MIDFEAKNPIICRNKNIISSDLDGEAVLMSLENSEYYGMNETLTLIWNIIENPKKFSDIIDELLYLYNIDKENCINEVSKILINLLDRSIIEVN